MVVLKPRPSKSIQISRAAMLILSTVCMPRVSREPPRKKGTYYALVAAQESSHKARHLHPDKLGQDRVGQRLWWSSVSDRFDVIRAGRTRFGSEADEEGDVPAVPHLGPVLFQSGFPLKAELCFRHAFAFCIGGLYL